MHRILIALLLANVSLWTAAQNVLMRSTPEAEGVRSADLQAYLDQMMNYSATAMHGIIVMRHGSVIAEAYNSPFRAEYGHTLYSASKTVTALAVGFCIQDTLLHLDDQVAQFLLDDLPEVQSDSLHGLTVEHLLTMQSGLPVQYTTLRRDSTWWTRALLGSPMTSMPGTHFAYDSMCTYLLSVLVQRVTGVSMRDFLQRRLFAPLGITGVQWEESPEGVSTGGWGLYMSLEGMARLGQMMLNRGTWGGQEVVSPEWIDQMTALHVDSSGYGYQVWMTSRPGSYKADGAYGQYIYVIPDKDMVIAMTQNHITNLPGVNAGSQQWLWTCQFLNRITDEAPLQRGRDYVLLQDVMRRYHLPWAGGEHHSAKHAALVRSPQTVQLASNDLGWETIRIQQSRDRELRLTVTTTEGYTFTLPCGHKRWITSHIPGQPYVYNDRRAQGQFTAVQQRFLLSASYGWYGKSGDDLYVRLHWVNWISGARLHFHFTGDRVTQVTFRPGYSSKDTNIPVL